MGLARQNWYSQCISRAIARENANREKGIPIPDTGNQKRSRPTNGPSPEESVQKNRKKTKSDLRASVKEYR